MKQYRPRTPCLEYGPIWAHRAYMNYDWDHLTAVILGSQAPTETLNFMMFRQIHFPSNSNPVLGGLVRSLGGLVGPLGGFWDGLETCFPNHSWCLLNVCNPTILSQWVGGWCETMIKRCSHFDRASSLFCKQ